MADGIGRQGGPAVPTRRVRASGARRGHGRRPSAARAAVPAFSLVELIIVVAIIAIIASIGLRRLSRHAESSAATAARHNETVLQLAVERYRAEHGSYPAVANVAAQLTQYSDANGVTSATPGPPHTFGPYVRKVPPVPLGPAKGSAKIAAAPAADVGWVYDPVQGTVAANETP